MPTICYFDGITVYVYFEDHPPPHVHVQYGSDWAMIAISSGKVIEGRLPPSVMKSVRKWIKARRGAIRTSWEAAQRGESPPDVEPPTGKGAKKKSRRTKKPSRVRTRRRV